MRKVIRGITTKKKSCVQIVVCGCNGLRNAAVLFAHIAGRKSNLVLIGEEYEERYFCNL